MCKPPLYTNKDFYKLDGFGRAHVETCTWKNHILNADMLELLRLVRMRTHMLGTKALRRPSVETWSPLKPSEKLVECR